MLLFFLQLTEPKNFSQTQNIGNDWRRKKLKAFSSRKKEWRIKKIELKWKGIKEEKKISKVFFPFFIKRKICCPFYLNFFFLLCLFIFLFTEKSVISSKMSYSCLLFPLFCSVEFGSDLCLKAKNWLHRVKRKNKRSWDFIVSLSQTNKINEQNK